MKHLAVSYCPLLLVWISIIASAVHAGKKDSRWPTIYLHRHSNDPLLLLRGLKRRQIFDVRDNKRPREFSRHSRHKTILAGRTQCLDSFLSSFLFCTVQILTRKRKGKVVRKKSWKIKKKTFPLKTENRVKCRALQNIKFRKWTFVQSKKKISGAVLECWMWVLKRKKNPEGSRVPTFMQCDVTSSHPSRSLIENKWRA